MLLLGGKGAVSTEHRYSPRAAPLHLLWIAKGMLKWGDLLESIKILAAFVEEGLRVGQIGVF